MKLRRLRRAMAVLVVLGGLLNAALGTVAVASPTDQRCQQAKKDKKGCEPTEAPAWWEGWSMDDPRLSQPIYDESIVEALTITVDDGVILEARVIRPVTPDGVTIPTIMHLSPYLGHKINPQVILPELQKHDYVARGYALVGVSIRGAGGSGGCIDYQGLRDRADYDQVIDALAAQPWSNGLIGAIGLSWDGTTLNAAALTGNPHLATIVPTGAITDWYKWSYIDGIPGYYHGYTFNLYGPLGPWWIMGGVVTGWDAPEAHEVAGRACRTAVESLVEQERTATLGVRSAWWDERDMTRFVDQINPDLAVLQVQGALDVGVRPDMLHEWDPALRARLENYHLVYGSWGHLWPDTPDIVVAGNPDAEFNRHPLTSWRVILLRWFDQWLKGTDTGISAMPGALIQDQLGQWHEEDALESSRAADVSLYPGPDGALSNEATQGETWFIDNGLGVDPRGSCVYVGIGLLVGCAPVKASTAQFFATEAIESETRYTGITRVTLRLKHSAPTGHVGVSLYDINGEKWKWLSYGMASLNLRDGDKHNFKPISPGQWFTHEVELMARDFVLHPGHRLGLAIGSQVDMNPRGIGGNGFAPVPSGGTTTLELGPDTVLHLNLLGETPLLPLE